MPPEIAVEPPFDPLAACEDEVRAQLAVIAARRMEPSIGFDKDMALCAAALTRALVSSSSERRQQAKAEAKAVSDIPIDLIVAHLRSLPDDEREDLCRRVLGTDDGAPLL